MSKPRYPGTVEIVPGVFVDGGAVYIADGQGEIVTWNLDEVQEDDGDAFAAALTAVALAAKEGPDAVRDNMNSGGERLKAMIARTLLATR